MTMAHFQEFLEALRREGELVEIDHPVDRDLEITEITDRVSKSPGGGKALLFTRVKGCDVPLAINTYGSEKRVKMALGIESYDEIRDRLLALLKATPPSTWKEKLSMIPKLMDMARWLPKNVSGGRCQEVVETENIDINRLPIMKCWPEDGGRFITLPMVITRDPDSGLRNVGMYRMQVFDGRTTGMHWQWHKVGADHFRRADKKMPVAVALGGAPVLSYSATAPLPPMVDEYHFAGFLQGRPVEMVKCKTIDLEVPASAEIVLEGYVDPGEPLRREGPFGDHTGYYSLADDYPVFHITAVTHAKNPVYPSIIVGQPPMEDGWLGKATERIFLPLLQLTFPEVVDMNLPVEGIFHNLVLISIKKQYPGHARKVVNGLWGTGQIMFSKFVIVVDDDVNVQNPGEVLWRVGNNVAPQRDCFFTKGPIDVLDHASEFFAYGSKMGIDATKKWPEEGFTREWPPDIVMSKDVKKRVDEMWSRLGL
jgi:4-hydroxy-3-polyprenylbenzoate decarboxylase